MIPRNKAHKEIARLRMQLPCYLNEKQEEWSKSLIQPCEPYFQVRGVNYCAKCGSPMGDSKKCPHCGHNHKSEPKKRTFYSHYLVNILSALGQYQAIRTFRVTFEFKAKCPVQVIDNGIVCEHYIDEGANVYTFGCPCTMGSFTVGYNIQAKCNSDIWNRNGNTWIYTSGRKGVVPFLKKRGVTAKALDAVNADPVDTICNVLRDPHMETMLKAKEYQLLHTAITTYHFDISSIWPQICIARRMHYRIADVNDWVDNIDLVRELGLDDHSPKYICPGDFDKMHSMLSQRVERVRFTKEAERMKADIEAAEPEYRRRVERYLGICIMSNGISIKPLASVSEFLEEGTFMHHCVFTAQYYKKNCLILSARMGNERIETIEVSLDNFTVIQSRGRFNKPTAYHNDIVSAVNGALDTIRKIAAA